MSLMKEYAPDEILSLWRKYFNAPDMSVEDMTARLSVFFDDEKPEDIEAVLLHGSSGNFELSVRMVMLLSELERIFIAM